MKTQYKLWSLLPLIMILCATPNLNAQVVALNDPIGTIYRYENVNREHKNTEVFKLIAKQGNKYTMQICGVDADGKVQQNTEKKDDAPQIILGYEIKEGVLYQSPEGLLKMVQSELKKSMKDVPKMVSVKLTHSGDLYGIPLRGKVGEELPESAFKVKVKASVFGMTFVYKTLSNKIVGKERLTTPAGTFDCLVVELRNKISFRIFGVFSDTTDEVIKLWVDPKVGVVQEIKVSTEKDNKEDKSEGTSEPAIRQLVSITHP